MKAAARTKRAAWKGQKEEEANKESNNPNGDWDSLLKGVIFMRGKDAPTENNAEEDDDNGLKYKMQKAMSQQRKAQEDLYHGAMRGDNRRCQRAMEAGADLAGVNARGITPLMLASSSSGPDAPQVVKDFIEKEADVTARDLNGWTALMHACRNGKTEAAKTLMNSSADPGAVTGDLKTTLILATTEGKADLVRLLINIKRVRDKICEKDNGGATALHYAVKDGSLDITRILIENNAKVNSRDQEGRQPLMIACEHGKLDCAKLLLKKGAEVDARDKGLRTSLMYACLNSYEQVAIWLCKKGNADPFIKDSSGETAITIADDMGLLQFKGLVMRRKNHEEED